MYPPAAMRLILKRRHERHRPARGDVFSGERFAEGSPCFEDGT